MISRLVGRVTKNLKYQHLILYDLYVNRYENGCLTPDMGSVFIALDPSVKANGCLQVSFS